MPTAYCLKCRAKKQIVLPRKITMRNGKEAMKGRCATCGREIFSITGQKAA